MVVCFIQNWKKNDAKITLSASFEMQNEDICNVMSYLTCFIFSYMTYRKNYKNHQPILIF